MPHLQQGLVIAVTGIGGVFAVLLVLMLLVTGIGKIFGKRPSPKTSPKKIEGGKAAATNDKQASAPPKPAEAKKDG
jgi:sodium pump decarboxylase gamma subunit